MVQSCLVQVVTLCMHCHLLYQNQPLSEQITATLENSACTCTIEEKISEVGEFLNHKLHNLASTMIQNDKRDPFDYQSLDIDKQMELVDPTLTQHNTDTDSRTMKRGSSGQPMNIHCPHTQRKCAGFTAYACFCFARITGAVCHCMHY